MRTPRIGEPSGLHMSEKSLALRLALFPAIVAISAAPLFGQALYGSDVTLTNQSSAAGNDATVTLTNVGIGSANTTAPRPGITLSEAVRRTNGATFYDGLPANSASGDLVNSNTLTHGTEAQVTNDVPNVTQNLLFHAMLQNGVQPHIGTTTSTLGDLYNDRQGASAN
jgi:hypothetical protein